LRQRLGEYLPSGNNLFSLTNVEDPIHLMATVDTNEYEVHIIHKAVITYLGDEAANASVLRVINIILKRMMKNAGYE
jgi:hypothetical protein